MYQLHNLIRWDRQLSGSWALTTINAAYKVLYELKILVLPKLHFSKPFHLTLPLIFPVFKWIFADPLFRIHPQTDSVFYTCNFCFKWIIAKTAVVKRTAPNIDTKLQMNLQHSMLSENLNVKIFFNESDALLFRFYSNFSNESLCYISVVPNRT